MTFLKRSTIAPTLALVLTVVVFRTSPALAASPPANDDFDNATVVAATSFTDTVDTSAATAAGDDPTTCAMPRNTVWYSLTPSLNETITVDTNGSAVTTDISAYTGSRGALAQVACGGTSGPQAQWAATAGVTYHIMVSAFSSGGVLTVHVTAVLPPPNDDFDNAFAISAVPYTSTEDTTGATSAADDPPGCGGTSRSVWYSLTPSVNETVFATAAGNGIPLSVSAYTGSRGSLSQVACSGGGGGATSWVASAGVTYHIMVSGTVLFNGIMTVQVTATVPPPNDDFAHATVVTALPFTDSVDASGATTAADDPIGCGGARNSVWYRFTPTVSETFTAGPGGSTYQTGVSVFTGSRGSLTQVACRIGSSGGAPPAKWAGTAGVTYFIMVVDSSTSGTGGNDHLSLTVSGAVPPPNDDFNHATAVSSLPFSDSIDTTGATAAADDPATCGSTDNSVWYDITPSVNELIVADISGSIYQPLVSVYTGSRGSLTLVTCGTAFPTTSFHVTAGVTYHIMVVSGSAFGIGGQLMFRLTAPAKSFVGLTPVRLMDTRTALGAPGPVGPGTTVRLAVLGHGGVPVSGVGAVVLNVTVTQPGAAGFVTVYPDGFSLPGTADLTFSPGQTISNLVVATVGSDGKVAFYNGSSGALQLVADVFGYFPTGTYGALTPARLMDTRTGLGASGPVGAGKTARLAVLGHGGIPASGVGAVVLNVTVTQPTAAGFITAYPEGITLPGTANLTFSPGRTISNLVVATVGTDGYVDFYNGSSGTAHLVVDVFGYLATGSYGTLTPARLMDTRSGLGAPGPVRAGKTVSLTVLGRGGVPAVGAAVVLNVTVTQPQTAGFVTVYPDGVTLPGTANLTFTAGQTIPNLVIATVGADGKVDFYNGSSGTVQLVADVFGYFN